MYKLSIALLFCALSSFAVAGCHSLDECFDVKKNNYTISVEGYSIWAEGIHLPSNQEWQLQLFKQQDRGFVRGFNLGDDSHWEEVIEIHYDPDAQVDPLQFAKIITRVCENSTCKTVQER